MWRTKRERERQWIWLVLWSCIIVLFYFIFFLTKIRLLSQCCLCMWVILFYFFMGVLPDFNELPTVVQMLCSSSSSSSAGSPHEKLFYGFPRCCCFHVSYMYVRVYASHDPSSPHTPHPPNLCQTWNKHDRPLPEISDGHQATGEIMHPLSLSLTWCFSFCCCCWGRNIALMTVVVVGFYFECVNTFEFFS